MNKKEVLWKKREREKKDTQKERGREVMIKLPHLIQWTISPFKSRNEKNDFFLPFKKDCEPKHHYLTE